MDYAIMIHKTQHYMVRLAIYLYSYCPDLPDIDRFSLKMDVFGVVIDAEPAFRRFILSPE
jgi:hypothetical protein